MAKKTSSKKTNKSKIIVASILAAVILVAALVSVVMVLAAGTQNVQSNISVSYSVDGVGARVSSTYAIVPSDTTQSFSKVSMTSDGTDLGSDNLEFSVGDTQGEKSIQPLGEITLSATSKRVVFEYYFVLFLVN